jgi:hypothetical protein
MGGAREETLGNTPGGDFFPVPGNLEKSSPGGMISPPNSFLLVPYFEDERSEKKGDFHLIGPTPLPSVQGLEPTPQNALTGLEWYGAGPGGESARSYALGSGEKIFPRLSQFLPPIVSPEGRIAHGRRGETDTFVSVDPTEPLRILPPGTESFWENQGQLQVLEKTSGLNRSLSNETPPPAYHTPSSMGGSWPTTPRSLTGDGHFARLPTVISESTDRYHPGTVRMIGGVGTQEVQKQVPEEMGGESLKRDRDIPSTPGSEEENRKEANERIFQEKMSNAQLGTAQAPMLLDDQEDDGSVTLPAHSPGGQRLQSLLQRSLGFENGDEEAYPNETMDEYWDRWAKRIEEANGVVNQRLTMAEGQLVENVQHFSQMLAHHTGNAQQFTQLFGHIGELFQRFQGLEQCIHTVSEQQLLSAQAAQALVQSGLETLQKNIYDRLGGAWAELDIRADVLLVRMQEFWGNEKVALREQVLENFLQQQSVLQEAPTLPQILAAREEIRLEMKAEVAEFIKFLNGEKNAISCVRIGVESTYGKMATYPNATGLEQRFSEIMQFCETAKPKIESADLWVQKLKDKVEEQHQTIRGLTDKLVFLEGKSQQMAPPAQIIQVPSQQHLQNGITREEMQLRLENESLKEKMRRMEGGLMPPPPPQPPSSTVPSYTCVNPVTQTPSMPTLAQPETGKPGMGVHAEMLQTPQKPKGRSESRLGGLFSKLEALDSDEEESMQRTHTIFNAFTPGLSVPMGRQTEVRPVRVQDTSNPQWPFSFATPLQNHAHRYLEPAIFDGQSKNWPKFIRTWNDYLRVADTEGRSTGREKALVFRQHVPENLKREMDSFMGQGHSFAQWVNRLSVRFGNTQELERKQWRELRLEFKGQLKVSDWLSYMSVFTEHQTRVRASNDEALMVVENAVPAFVQTWVKQFKLRKVYKEKRVHLRLTPGPTTAQVQEAIYQWVNMSPKFVQEISPGVFEVKVMTTDQVEMLLTLNGKTVNARGEKAQVDVPPHEWNMSELVENIAERLECQPPRENERSNRATAADGFEPGWEQTPAVFAPQQNFQTQPFQPQPVFQTQNAFAPQNHFQPVQAFMPQPQPPQRPIPPKRPEPTKPPVYVQPVMPVAPPVLIQQLSKKPVLTQTFWGTTHAVEEPMETHYPFRPPGVPPSGGGGIQKGGGTSKGKGKGKGGKGDSGGRGGGQNDSAGANVPKSGVQSAKVTQDSLT